MVSSNVLILKDFKSPAEVGTHYRLLCMTGKKKGDSYYLKGNRLVIGRGEKCDIQVFDVKSSREHAELTKIGNSYVVTDLKSQNGVVVNDLKITQHTLQNGDRIIIGQTVFKYGLINVDIDGDVEESVEVEEENGSSKSIDKKKKNDPAAKRKKIVIAIVIALGGYLFLGDEGGENSSKQRKSAKIKDVSDEFTAAIQKKRLQEDRELGKKLNVIFARGLRELREKNYYRALDEFALALILSPNNGRALAYRDRTKQALDDEIDKNFIKAARDTEALKYKEASISYCAIMNLLQNYPDDKRYKDAKANINTLENKMGLDKGEIKCL